MEPLVCPKLPFGNIQFPFIFLSDIYGNVTNRMPSFCSEINSSARKGTTSHQRLRQISMKLPCTVLSKSTLKFTEEKLDILPFLLFLFHPNSSSSKNPPTMFEWEGYPFFASAFLHLNTVFFNHFLTPTFVYSDYSRPTQLSLHIFSHFLKPTLFSSHFSSQTDFRRHHLLLLVFSSV